MVLKIDSREKNSGCSVASYGISISQDIISNLGLKQKIDRVEVGYLSSAECVLVSKKSDEKSSFLLSYCNSRVKTGGKISCEAFIKNKLKFAVKVPQLHIKPILLKHEFWGIALILDAIKWQYSRFDKLDISNLGPQLGVYELLGKDNNILRIGEGVVKDRLNEHLKNGWNHVINFRYLILPDKSECELLENILISEYKRDNNNLPILNSIHS